MLWGRVTYYLMTGDIDQAAHWFGEMIERRDPFVLIHLRSRDTAAAARTSALARARGADATGGLSRSKIA